MTETRKKLCKSNFNLRSLRLSLKYRPEILKLILKMRQCIRKKNSILKEFKRRLKELENNILYDNSTTLNSDTCENIDITTNKKQLLSLKTQDTISITPSHPSAIKNKPRTKNRSSQTDNNCINNQNEPKVNHENSGWQVNEESETKSIAEQVKEAAQDAIKQSGMVYVESAGMYYDYKTGYYYNSELGLYYHTDTECYYYYSEDKRSFEFHSYPDRSAASSQALLEAHEKRKAKKHKMEKYAEEDIDNLTKNLSQDGEDDPNGVKKPKRKKNKRKENKVSKENKDDQTDEQAASKTSAIEIDITESEQADKKEDGEVENSPKVEELEDGECSESGSEGSVSEEDESNASTCTASDDESVARSHPPCMRVIVRETSLPKLRVGSLFIVTKDGGTVGREGEHAILLRDTNVSRNHLDIRYDASLKSYIAIDLGSKNGSILNGSRMSESQIISEPMKVVHGSTLQLGETKLLCHIHPGNDTCGHCEPGLLMETLEKEKKVAYTRTCNIKKQHELELARLKNKYGNKPQLAIEETAYNDRAQARREAVGSSHYAEKTQTSDIETSIAPDNKGFKLLEKMGWSKGEGLGKDSQGDIEPVPLIANEGKTGLGAIPSMKNPANNLGPATMRLASRTKMLQPPAKAFQGILDEDSE